MKMRDVYAAAWREEAKVMNAGKLLPGRRLQLREKEDAEGPVWRRKNEKNRLRKRI